MNINSQLFDTSKMDPVEILVFYSKNDIFRVSQNVYFLT